MACNMNFLGRTEELSVLEKEYEKSGFVVVYGRRRVGKTTLIKEFIKNKNALYFLAGLEPDRQNLNKFTASLASFSNQPYLADVRFDSWQKAFSAFVEVNKDQPKILVIDEFQYLVESNSAFASIFQEAWDEILKDHDVMVILCGSHISMMISSTLRYSSPLYGRRTAQIKLEPLSFVEFSKAFPDRSFEEKVKIYSVTGGVPKYIEFFNNELTLTENISKNVLDKSGFLYEEPNFLLEKEVREPVNYFSIIKAISMGNHRVSEIATVLEQKTNGLSPYLATLTDLFLLEKRVPITEKEPEKSRRGLYYINDKFIDFWFKFVYPYKSELELDNKAYVLDKLDTSFIPNHVSYVYEQICREIFVRLCFAGTVEFHVSKIGAYWNSNTEIDVVAIDNHNKKIFAGECKFNENPVDIKVYSDLLEKCSNVPEFKTFKIIYGIFSKSGFVPRLTEIADKNGNLLLFETDKISE